MAVFSTPLTIALVSVSASAQDVDNLRCYGAYTLIIEHHVQALEAAARHLKDAARHRGQATGLAPYLRLVLCFRLGLSGFSSFLF